MPVVKNNVSLKNYSTMRLGGEAKAMIAVKSEKSLVKAITWAANQNLPFIVIGDGSNIIWRDEGFQGVLIVNRIKGFVLKNHGDTALVTIGAGENWDNVVAKTVKKGWSGLECLSLIPGTAGATPVQNVGAYGAEVKDVLQSVRAFDWVTHKIVTIPQSDCNFSYRSSRFKTSDRGRYAIISITIKLTKDVPRPPFYRALTDYFAAHNITEYSPQIIRDAVIAIRTSKLPDPAKVANNGSFFANPIITKDRADTLLVKFPTMPHWPNQDGMVKLAAAWLIEQAGFKDYHDGDTGMATWSTQPLVLVNESAESTQDLLVFKQKIMNSVQQEFGITLEQEPELLP